MIAMFCDLRDQGVNLIGGVSFCNSCQSFHLNVLETGNDPDGADSKLLDLNGVDGTQEKFPSFAGAAIAFIQIAEDHTVGFQVDSMVWEAHTIDDVPHEIPYPVSNPLLN